MASQFQEGGMSFRYPENWTLEREESENGWTATLQSPGTAFLVLRFDGGMPSREEVAETALEALRSEYPELEAEAEVGSLAGQMAVGHEIRFFSLDLTNTAWTRAFYTEAGTVLVLWQTSDQDPGNYQEVLQAICASLRVEGD